MLFRTLTLSVTALALSAVTALAQTVTYSPTTYPNNNLWSQNEGNNGHIRADLNNDGREDFISGNDASFASGCTGSFAITLSKGDGSYAAPVCYTIPGGIALYFATGDFNADGNMDIVVTNELGDLYVYANDGRGNLRLINTVALAGEASGVVAGDVNHDGKIDLVYDIASSGGVNNLVVLFGNLDGTFTTGPTSSFTMNNEPGGALAIGDFDNDNRTDILVTGVSMVRNQILYGDNAGHFAAGPIIGGNTVQYTDYDINNDGTMDLIGAPFGSNPLGVNTYYKYLDIEWGHYNRTVTSQQVNLKSCTGDGAPPVVADVNGDGINDIIVAEAADCAGNGPYTLNVLLGNVNLTFQPEQVIYTTSDWISEWHVMRASHSSKPDLTLWQSVVSQRQISSPEEVVLVNTTAGSFPACTPMNFRATQVNVCSPTSTTGATSPVTFSLAGSDQTAGRDMELWIDGTKVNENHKNAYSYYAFLNATVPLSAGQHSVTGISVGWDRTLVSTGFTLTVGSSSCPIPTYVGLNICSPIQNSTVGSPVLAYATGNAGGPITRMEVWVDGVKMYSTFGSNTLKTTLPLVSGWHTFTYFLVPAQGGALYSDTLEIAVP